jgi:hypothetical protein
MVKKLYVLFPPYKEKVQKINSNLIVSSNKRARLINFIGGSGYLMMPINMQLIV